MKLFKWLSAPLKSYNERRRAIDIEIFWPACCDLTDDIKEARQVFLTHVLLDDAWSELSGAEIREIVGNLRAPQ